MPGSSHSSFSIDDLPADIIDYVHDMLVALADLAARAEKVKLATAIRAASKLSEPGPSGHH